MESFKSLQKSTQNASEDVGLLWVFIFKKLMTSSFPGKRCLEQLLPDPLSASASLPCAFEAAACGGETTVCFT